MDFSIKSLDAKNTIASLKVGCIVVGVYETKKLSPEAQALDVKGQISAAVKAGDISGKAGAKLMLRNVDGVAAERVQLIGLGKAAEISDKDFRTIVKAAAEAMSGRNTSEEVIALPFGTVKNCNLNWELSTAVRAIRDKAYRFDTLKSKKERQSGPKKVTFLVENAQQAVAKNAIAQGVALANGVALAKDLGNLPGNYCTPTYLADTAKKLAKDFGLGIEVLDRRQIEALKMGSFLSVTRGSDEPPKFMVIKHMGGKIKDAPIVLVGKGITFDSGGISLKPGAAMDEMKFDMCGAASVLGAIRAIAELKLKLNVIGVIASCENMPSGRATKPGDIVTSMSGQTIEVLNTDAEGRLILCDALTYAERFKPALVIDVATLTGACVTALGHHNSGLFTRLDKNHEELMVDLMTAGKRAGDTAWPLPIEEAYQEQLKSNFADMANVGSPGGGSITAACFLERFTRKYIWAHLDIAGTAWRSGAAKGATGRPVPLLTTYLIDKAQAANAK